MHFLYCSCSSGVLLILNAFSEANGSYVIEGIVKYLIGNTMEANILRDSYVIKVIPMLNPDGVIVGNNRCSLAGKDLNRQWRDPIKHLCPEIYEAKKVFFDFTYFLVVY